MKSDSICTLSSTMHKWTAGALAIIVLSSTLFAILFPRVKQQLLSDDIYYHLIVARNMLQTGDFFPTYDKWFLAPVPRIHIYPPLFHWLLAGLVTLSGLTLTEIALRLQLLLYPTALLAFFALSRTVLSPRGSFLSVFLVATTFPFAARAHLAIPETFELIIICLGLLAYIKRAEWWCGFLLLCMLLLHTGSPLLFAAALATHQFYIREVGNGEAKRRLAPIFALAFPGILLQIHWGILNAVSTHVYTDKLRPTLWFVFKTYCKPWLGIAPILVPLGLSIWGFIRLRRVWFISFSLILTIAFSVILITYSARFSSYALIPLSLVSALVLDNWMKAVPSPYFILLTGILLTINIPYSLLNFKYKYDYFRPHNEAQEALLKWGKSVVAPHDEVCVTDLFDAYRVNWFINRTTSLLDFNCGDARFLYLHGDAQAPKEWSLICKEGDQYLYEKMIGSSAP